MRFILIDLQDTQACLGLVDQTVTAFNDVNVLVNATAFGGRGTLIDTSTEL